MPDNASSQVETEKDFGPNPAGIVKRWVAEFEAYDKAFKEWRRATKRIIKRYRDEGTPLDDQVREEGISDPRKFNILWSNIQTLQPALLSRTPVPEVVRRWKDRDPVVRAAAEILERSLAYSIDSQDFDEVAKSARDDFLFSGRGVAWARYVPTFGDPIKEQIFLQVPPEGEPFRDDAGNEVQPLFDVNGMPFMEGEEFEPVIFEEVVDDYVNWEDFGHTVSTTWAKVTGVWRREFLTREQLIARFGPIGRKVPLKMRRKELEDSERVREMGIFMTGEVREVWDKDSRKVYWIAPDFKERPLDMENDPLGLENFFPCPKPLYGTITTDSLVPVPDYTQYEMMADQLDEMTERIGLLIEAVRVAGVYNGEFAEIENLLSPLAENNMIAVSNWALFADKGGARGSIDWYPVDQVVTVLTSLIEARERVKQDLFEISGISDIVRGQVDPREKATASRLKAQFGSLRLREQQDAVANFLRDLIRIHAEIMAEQFEPETLLTISGWDMSGDAREDAEGIFNAAIRLLKDEKLRGFRIDIETDSTIFEDRQAEQQERIEFLSSATAFLERAVPAAEQFPQLAPLLSELLLFGVRSFRSGRNTEAIFEEALEDMASQQGQTPDPMNQIEMEKLNLEREKLNIEREKLQAENQQAQAENQLALTQEASRREIELIKVQQSQQPGQESQAALTQMVAQQAEALANVAAQVQQTQQLVAALVQQVSPPQTVLQPDETSRMRA